MRGRAGARRETGRRSLQLTMLACGASWLTIARFVTMTLLLPHMTSHEPRRMRCTSSGVGVATKHPESGTHVSPLNEPAALLSTEVHLGLLSAGQVAPIAKAAPPSRSRAARGRMNQCAKAFRCLGTPPLKWTRVKLLILGVNLFIV
jgi:hypothetical protein